MLENPGAVPGGASLPPASGRVSPFFVLFVPSRCSIWGRELQGSMRHQKIISREWIVAGWSQSREERQHGETACSDEGELRLSCCAVNTLESALDVLPLSKFHPVARSAAVADHVVRKR
jgi:hypothetical protein